MSGRLLVTGSRDWADIDAIRAGLADAAAKIKHLAPITLIHGKARGADTIADAIWARWASSHPDLCLKPEPHAADWNAHGKAAGAIRNQLMVSLGADICAAFPLGRSMGTRDCMARAAAAGIPVHNYGS